MLKKVLTVFAPVLSFCMYRSSSLSKKRMLSFAAAPASSGSSTSSSSSIANTTPSLSTFLYTGIKTAEGDNSSVLNFREDRYGGVIIDPKQFDQIEDDEAFSYRLGASIDYWKSITRRGIWLQIPISKASYVPIAAMTGFVFHHAEKEYVMMNHWLSSEENRMPPNASHQVGVGCVVRIDDKLLLVQEKSGPLKGTGVWKLPTGLVDVGEDIHAAAIREVKEETGIDVEFDKMLCFRQSHGALFGKSDLFFLCVLQPLSTEIKIQEAEIEDAKWLHYNTYMSQPFFRNSAIYGKINEMIRRLIVEEDITHDPFLSSRILESDSVGVASQFMYEAMSASISTGNSSSPLSPPPASAASAATTTATTAAAAAATTTTTTTTTTGAVATPTSTLPVPVPTTPITVPMGMKPVVANRKVSGMKVTTLPIGFRPGHNALYHIEDL